MSRKPNNLTQEELKSWLSWSRDTKTFTWLKASSKRVRVGDVAGTKNKQGTIIICLHRHMYSVPRLAFYHEFNSWPTAAQVKHFKLTGELLQPKPKLPRKPRGPRGSTGVKGVQKYRNSGRYLAKYCSRPHDKHIGIFDKIEDAANAYNAYVASLAEEKSIFASIRESDLARHAELHPDKQASAEESLS